MLQSGVAEDFKAHFHAAIGVLVGVAAIYNACAWLHRREHHLAVNTLVYAAGAGYEVAQTLRHLRSGYSDSRNEG